MPIPIDPGSFALGFVAGILFVAVVWVLIAIPRSGLGSVDIRDTVEHYLDWVELTCPCSAKPENRGDAFDEPAVFFSQVPGDARKPGRVARRMARDRAKHMPELMG